MKYLILKITNNCNLKCMYCYAKNRYEDSKDMCFKTAKNAIDYMMSLGDNKLKIQFTGGEPLMNFKLIEKIIDYCNDNYNNYDIQYALQTNATLLDEKIVEKTKELNIKIGVSIDGLDVNDMLRPYKNGNPSTLDTLKGMYMLRYNNVLFGITTVVSSINLPYLEDFVNYLIAFGIKSISFDILKPKIKDHLKLMPDMRKFNTLLNKLKNYPIYIKNLQKRPNNKYCYLNSGDLLFVNEFGDIYPCPTLEGYFYMGNINKKTNIPLMRYSLDMKDGKCYARKFLIRSLTKTL